MTSRNRDLNPKLHRWAHRLTEYIKVLLWRDRIKWQAEKENLAPVAFSRVPFETCEERLGIIDSFRNNRLHVTMQASTNRLETMLHLQNSRRN